MKTRKIAQEIACKSPREELVEIEPFEDFPDCQFEMDFEEQESEQSCEEVAVDVPPDFVQTEECKTDIVVKR